MLIVTHLELLVLRLLITKLVNSTPLVLMQSMKYSVVRHYLAHLPVVRKAQLMPSRHLKSSVYTIHISSWVTSPIDFFLTTLYPAHAGMLLTQPIKSLAQNSRHNLMPLRPQQLMSSEHVTSQHQVESILVMNLLNILVRLLLPSLDSQEESMEPQSRPGLLTNM